MRWLFIVQRSGTMDTAYLTWLVKLIEEDNLVKFYKNRKWRELRREALTRDNYECQACKKRGRYARAENVHHRKEVKQFPDLALDIDNVESVCIRCHNQEHKRFGRCKNKQKTENDFTNFVDKECW